VIGYDRDAPSRLLIPEKFDLFDRSVKIVAGMNDEKQRLV
jgi:hypothetical protein